MTRWKRAWVVDSSTRRRTIKGALAFLPNFVQIWVDGLALLVVTRPLDKEFLPRVKEISEDEVVCKLINADTSLEAHSLIEKEANLEISACALRWPMEPKDIFYVALVRSIRKSLTDRECLSDGSIRATSTLVLKRLEQTMWQNLFYPPVPQIIGFREFRLFHDKISAGAAEFVEKLFIARLGLKPWTPELELEVRARHCQTDDLYKNSARIPFHEMGMKIRTFMEILRVFAPNLAQECLSLSSIKEFCFELLCTKVTATGIRSGNLKIRDETFKAIRSALKRFPFLFEEHALSGSLPDQSSSLASTDQSSSLASTDQSSSFASTDQSSSLASTDQSSSLASTDQSSTCSEQLGASSFEGTKILDSSLPRVKVERFMDDPERPCSEQFGASSFEGTKILDSSLPRVKVDASPLQKRRTTNLDSGLDQPQKRSRE